MLVVLIISLWVNVGLILLHLYEYKDQGGILVVDKIRIAAWGLGGPIMGLLWFIYKKFRARAW